MKTKRNTLTYQTSVVQTLEFSSNPKTLHSAVFRPCQRASASASDAENSKFFPPCLVTRALTPWATSAIEWSDLKLGAFIISERHIERSQNKSDGQMLTPGT